MRLINRYVLKEHAGPFVFALSALTSLLLLQVVARKFGDLVGRGLSWQVIVEFFVLSLPYTIALTLPMAVLVAVLYAFSRMASENEVTALKAGGVSTRSLMWPALGAATLLALFMLWFNDQVLPTANHELATLQIAIFRTKPTFALKEQVINAVKEGQLYLRAGGIDRDQSGRIRDVTIYDVADPAHRRTIYGDSGTLAFATNKRDLVMHLYHGWMLTAPSSQPSQLTRVYYRSDELKVRDVANSFENVDADTAMKGEREMSICEMQKEYAIRDAALQHAMNDSIEAAWRIRHTSGKAPNEVEPKPRPIRRSGGIGAVYCTFVTKYLHVPEAAAEEVPRQDSTTRAAMKRDSTRRVAVQDSLKRDSIRRVAIQDSIKRDSTKRNIATVLTQPQDTSKKKQDTTAKAAAPAAPVATPIAPPATPVPPVTQTPGAQPAPNVLPPPARTYQEAAQAAAKTDAGFEMTDANMRIQDARHWRNRYDVEIQKKFSLAAACIVFIVIGAPIALRFPSGGVGLVIGVSFLVFAIYYAGLIGGESLADHNIISPKLAMWADNVIFLIIGLVLVSRMGNEGVTGRGGNFGELAITARDWFTRQTRRVRVPMARRAEG